MGIIRECGGKMHLSEGSAKDAYADFFEVRRVYESGWSRVLSLRFGADDARVPTVSDRATFKHNLQAFKNYDEAGSTRRIQCLKYVVLASMLMEQDYINPFDSQEIKVA